MRYPEFFDEIEPIVLVDELGGFLGTFEDGIVEIRYLDVVRMAGHSCATVAGAWLMTRAALAALWPDGLPVRGGVRVALREEAGVGNTGVVGAVIGNITGAAVGDMGFSGLQGRWVRRGLMVFGSPIGGDVRFTRLDDGAAVDVRYRPGKVADPGAILREALAPGASEAARSAFPTRWQAMVRTILDRADEVVEVEPVR